MKKSILSDIVKDCYWDSNLDVVMLEAIVKSSDKREKQKLFSKIIYNSKDKLLALKLFSKEQLKEFFQEFKITYNQRYITRHVLVLKSLLLDEKIDIKGLEWTKI